MKKITAFLALVSTMLLLTQCNKNCIISARCNLVPDAGDCYAAISKYYYDKKDKECKVFIWGGCAGVVPFETMEECENQCDCK